MSDRTILTLNTGSSSLKTGLFHLAPEPSLMHAATVERIGEHGARLTTDGAISPLRGVDHAGALRAALDALLPAGAGRPAAVGHRIVHGGRAFVEPCPIDDAVVAALRDLAPLAPNHLPPALAVIDAARGLLPDARHIACFDTAFHRTMPRVSRLYPLPPEYEASGVIRFGFHGLSCESVVAQLRAIDPRLAAGRCIIAHLGAGASMTAVAGGRSVETTMGFTPAGGLMMATRTGDLDPGVLVYLMRRDGLDADAVDDLVNHRAGLRGLSGGFADVRDLLEREISDPRAADALALFCHQARKTVGSLAATLGGLDGLVFTGGIGEHAAPIRARICDGLAFLGITLDKGRNDRHEPLISPDGAPVAVRIVRTDEDRVIAAHTARVLADIEEEGEDHVSV